MSPSRAPRPCSTPGCPNLVTSTTAQCSGCQRRADAFKRQAQINSYGRSPYGGDWPDVRAAHLAAHRWCKFCGHIAREVDHIDGNPMNNRPENLRSLCRVHHRQRTARDQPGGTQLP